MASEKRQEIFLQDKRRDAHWMAQEEWQVLLFQGERPDGHRTL